MPEKSTHKFSAAGDRALQAPPRAKEVGGQGQQKLKAARVLVVGAGGLGSPVIMYLAAAGVGTIGIVDDDRVSLDNLQRQIAHDTAGIGTPKVESAARRSARLNPHVAVEAIEARLDAGNALDLIGALRHRRRRLGQFRHPLPRLRRLLPRQDAAGVRRRRPVRRLRLDFKPHERAPTARPTRPIAACSRRRRRRAPSPTAPRSACSARWSASSARCRRPRS